MTNSAKSKVLLIAAGLAGGLVFGASGDAKALLHNQSAYDCAGDLQGTAGSAAARPSFGTNQALVTSKVRCPAPDSQAAVAKTSWTTAKVHVNQTATGEAIAKLCYTQYNGNGGGCDVSVSASGSGHKTLDLSSQLAGTWNVASNFGYVYFQAESTTTGGVGFAGVKYTD